MESENEIDQQDRKRVKEVALGSCLYLVRSKSEWLEKWGTEEGKKRWLADVGYYKNPKSAAAAYRQYKKKEETHHAIFGFVCSKGLPFRATREIVGPFFHERYTAAFCDMQENCKKYTTVDQALIDLAKYPKGNA